MTDLFGPVSPVTILNGDAVTVLKRLRSGSINMCVTSPPYFGLRDYGHDGQIGLEPTPEEFVKSLVNVFREVRRALRDDGTLWLNLGDSYGKNKQLMGIPWRVAFALQADGWYLRQDIIWNKPNPMPESVTDRCTKAHEYIFLMSKSPRYYFDADAIREPSVQPAKLHGKGGALTTRGEQGYANASGAQRDNSGGYGTDGFRNKRSVWTVTTRPYAGAHFATFPPALIEPCILAGCPEGGTVLDPFGGSGTTGAVAKQNRRKAVLIELNPDYIPLIRERVSA